jgi:hypothetical protein
MGGAGIYYFHGPWRCPGQLPRLPSPNATPCGILSRAQTSRLKIFPVPANQRERSGLLRSAFVWCAQLFRWLHRYLRANFGAIPTRCLATTITSSVFTLYIQQLYVLGRKWLNNALVRFVIPFLSLSSADRFIRPKKPHRRQNQRRRPATTNLQNLQKLQSPSLLIRRKRRRLYPSSLEAPIGPYRPPVFRSFHSRVRRSL